MQYLIFISRTNNLINKLKQPKTKSRESRESGLNKQIFLLVAMQKGINESLYKEPNKLIINVGIILLNFGLL